MKVLLLGPNGQLGSDIRRAHERSGSGIELISVGREIVDVSNVDRAIDAFAAMQFDAIINTTGYHKTDEVERNAQLAFTVNAHFVRRLAELCGERKARLLTVSTDYVFGGQAKREPLIEDDPKAPLNVYGASKAMGEDLALLSGADVLVTRVSALFGVAGASGKGGNFVETMIRLAREKGELRVVDDQIMIPTGTAEAADAILRLLKAGAPRGVYHVACSGPPVSWCGFTREILRLTGSTARLDPVLTEAMPTPAMRPPYSAMSNRLLHTSGLSMNDWNTALDRYLVQKRYK